MGKMYYVFFVLLTMLPTTSCAQLYRTANAPCAGDVLEKRDLTWSEVHCDANVVDLSHATPGQRPFTSRWTAVGDMGHWGGDERGTRHYVAMRGDTLCDEGFENHLRILRLDRPVVLAVFPAHDGDSVAGQYHGRGSYCEQMRMCVSGSYVSRVSTVPRLILPDGDTLHGVTRIHVIKMQSCRYTQMTGADTTIAAFAVNSVRQGQSDDFAPVLIDEYRWYVRGFRYPVLERYVTRLADAGVQNLAEETYYTDPLHQRYVIFDNRLSEETAQEGCEENKLQDAFMYTFGQNRTSRRVTVHYETSVSATVSVVLADVRGLVYQSQSQTGQKQGDVSFSYGLLPRGTYVLYISYGDRRHVEKFNVN